MAKTKNLHLYDVIKRPVITERSTELVEAANQYAFEVDMAANKIQIAEAVMRIFDVDVLKVNTMVVAPRRGRRGRTLYVRRRAWKKAIVTVPAGQSIPIFNA